MKALTQARKLIQKQPLDQTSRTLSALLAALESDQTFDLGSLYRLPYDDFQLALDLIADWRLDRYYSPSIRMLDMPMHGEIPQMNTSLEPA